MKTLTIGTFLAVVLAGNVWAQQAQTHDDRPKITVTGGAAVNVDPDRIMVSLGIQTLDAELLAAKQKSSDLLKKAVAVAKSCGVPDKGIQTDSLSISPRWKNEYERQSFLGYLAQHTLIVTLDDAEKVDALITAALQAGLDRINGIDFQTSELKKYREQARELALKAAKEKADKMAAVLGQTVGNPIQINEAYAGTSWGARRSHGGMAQVQVDSGSSTEGSDTVPLGKLSIQASVSVTFELKETRPSPAR